MAVEVEQGFRPHDEASLVAYIKATLALVSRLGSGSLNSINIREVGDSNLNFVYIVNFQGRRHRRQAGAPIRVLRMAPFDFFSQESGCQTVCFSNK
jgi:5-methylthioribose kinase